MDQARMVAAMGIPPDGVAVAAEAMAMVRMAQHLLRQRAQMAAMLPMVRQAVWEERQVETDRTDRAAVAETAQAAALKTAAMAAAAMNGTQRMARAAAGAAAEVIPRRLVPHIPVTAARLVFMALEVAEEEVQLERQVIAMPVPARMASSLLRILPWSLSRSARFSSRTIMDRRLTKTRPQQTAR